MNEHIALLHHLVHVAHQQSSQTLSLDVLDGRNQTRGAERVRPGVFHLPHELIVASITCDVVERCSGLGAEDDQHLADRVVGELDVDDGRPLLLQVLKDMRVHIAAPLEGSFRNTNTQLVEVREDPIIEWSGSC